jgi:hypothetical protein
MSRIVLLRHRFALFMSEEIRFARLLIISGNGVECTNATQKSQEGNCVAQVVSSVCFLNKSRHLFCG